MEKKRALLIVVLLLAVVAVAAYPVYALWTAPAEAHPTLMYFRADL